MIQKDIFMQHSLLQPVEVIPFPFPFAFISYSKPEGKQNPTGVGIKENFANSLSTWKGGYVQRAIRHPKLQQTKQNTLWLPTYLHVVWAYLITKGNFWSVRNDKMQKLLRNRQQRLGETALLSWFQALLFFLPLRKKPSTGTPDKVWFGKNNARVPSSGTAQAGDRGFAPLQSEQKKAERREPKS